MRRAGNIVGDRSYTIFLFHHQIMLLAWIGFFLTNTFFISGEWNWSFWQAISTLLLLAPVTEPSIG